MLRSEKEGHVPAFLQDYRVPLFMFNLNKKRGKLLINIKK